MSEQNTFALSLLDKINYHKSLSSSENAIKTLKTINPKLQDTNILTLAFLSQNEAISEQERDIFHQCLKAKALQEYESWQRVLHKNTEELEPPIKSNE